MNQFPSVIPPPPSNLLPLHLIDVENIPSILEKVLTNPELPVGQNLLKRDIFSLKKFSSFINFYE